MSHNFNIDHDAGNSVSEARQAIEELLEHDETLEEEYIEAAQAEYEELVRLIQSNNIPITDDFQDRADRIRRNW